MSLATNPLRDVLVQNINKSRHTSTNHIPHLNAHTHTHTHQHTHQHTHTHTYTYPLTRIHSHANQQ